MYLVWDERFVYLLMGGANPKKSSLACYTSLIWEAVELAAGQGKTFDFEGSMAQNIENSFSQFGTEQISYFNIKKYNSRLTKTVLPHIKL